MLSDEEISRIKEQLKNQIGHLPPEQKEKVAKQIDDASAEQIEALISTKSDECLFCEIGKGNVETVKIYEDAAIVAFLDIAPSIPGQVIISPKEHYQFLFQLPDQLLWDMIRAAKLIMPIIVNITKANGLNLQISQGPGAGQRIPHVTINLIPRAEGDKAVFAWQRNEIKTDELSKIGKLIAAGVTKSLQEERLKLEKKVAEETKVTKKESPKEEQAEQTEEFPRRMP